MSFDTIILEADGPVSVLSLNRPDRRNSLNDRMETELVAAFEALARDPACRVVVLTGVGTAFCAGGDFGSAAQDAFPQTPLGAEQRMLRNAEVARAIVALAKPVIAAVNGPAVGGGCNLALICDLVVAAEDATFSQRHVGRGFCIDVGGTWVLPRLVGLHKAKELALTGDLVLSAAEAAAFGLVNRVVPSAELLATAKALATRIAAGAPQAIRLVKEGLNRSAGMTFGEALEFEARAQALCATTEDAREGVRAFVERRAPRFEGV